jgi:hypothetical protein
MERSYLLESLNQENLFLLESLPQESEFHRMPSILLDPIQDQSEKEVLQMEDPLRIPSLLTLLINLEFPYLQESDLMAMLLPLVFYQMAN